ncbi:MAG TPA: hypothetical protein VNZ57_15685 [Longimicrobiales bacterium]|nr:hypothetical protein [Longimicrobiales bacterium]
MQYRRRVPLGHTSGAEAEGDLACRYSTGTDMTPHKEVTDDEVYT